MIYDHSIFRAYDMRGTYPNQVNEKVAYAAGQAFVQVMGAKKVALGRDVRHTGESLVNAVAQGVIDAGADVIMVGVISTEMLYFASLTLDCDGGISVTASHNPPQWNGFKFIGKNAVPLTREERLGEIYNFIESDQKVSQFNKGTISEKDILGDYVAYLIKNHSPQNIKDGLKVVANANFGANGKVIDSLVKDMPISLIRLNWNEDGTFPKGTPDPMLPGNRKELVEMIKNTPDVDFGVAWDADADRAFFYDEKGRFFHGCYITALLVDHYLKQEKGATVVLERRLTWANLDAVSKDEGQVHMSRTGHGYIKKAMRDSNAIFAGESSGHFYYRDFGYCDNGAISFLVITGIFSDALARGEKVSSLLDYYLNNFPISLQELNYTTEKAAEIMEKASEKYADAEQNHEDGLSVEYKEWRFNLRMSSNEPVLRLNYEAKNQEEFAKREKELTDFVESFGAVLRDDN